jgi:hypothetical protein
MEDKGKIKDVSLKKKEYYELTVEDPRNKTEFSPLLYLDSWDFTVAFLSVLLRFLVEINLKSIKIEEVKGGKFSFKAYFDIKHIIRWIIHLISSLLGLLVLPRLFVNHVYNKYDIGITDWTLLGTLVVCLVGYDLFKIGGKVLLYILNKITGYKHDDK